MGFIIWEEDLMAEIKININKLKSTISKLSMAVEKSKINPKAGWIELLVSEGKMTIKVGNYDYYLESEMSVDGEDSIHATIVADTFIPLVSKLDVDEVTMTEYMNALVMRTKSSEYTFPIIKDRGKVKAIDSIDFDSGDVTTASLTGEDISSIAESNASGLTGALFTKDIQQFVYVDNEGALTFTENIYLNTFSNPSDVSFRFLLNGTQAKLLKVFESFENVTVEVENTKAYDASIKVRISAQTDEKLTLVMITQSTEVVQKFPCIKLRKLANAVAETHAIIDKKTLDKALARLMVFDKKFDITVLNYSKFVWSENSVRLVSIKNQNYEILQYKSGKNTSEHESIIRFADIVNQLKAIQSKEVDISYGDSPAIVINADNIKILIPEIVSVDRT